MRSGSLMRPYTSLLCLFLMISSSTFGQLKYNINFSSINTDDGLPNNTINAIAKDKLGFIWIGTNDGLCKYESSGQVKIYKKGIPETEGGIESSNIRALYLDSKENLWIGTRLGGLTKYNQATGEWLTFRHERGNPTSLSNDEILCITEDKMGRIWVGTEDGLNVFDNEKERFTSFKIDNKDSSALQGKAVLSIIEDDRGWIWIGTWAGGLHLFVPGENGQIKDGKFRHFLPSEKVGAANVWSVFQDSKKRYWIGSRGDGLFLMKLPEGVENQSVDDKWSPVFYNYTYDKNDNSSLSVKHIQTIYEDSKKNIWVATVQGLNRIIESEDKSTVDNKVSKPQLSFYKYYYDPNDLSSIANNDVSTIFEDDQGIYWFGTYSGISQYNPLTNQFEVHDFFEDIAKTPNAQNIYIDDNQIAWVSNGENGLLKYNLKNWSLIDPKGKFDFLTGENIFSLFSPDDEHLYISVANAVMVYNMKNHSVKKYPLPKEFVEKFDSPFIRSMFKCKREQLWIASEDGLLVLNEDSGKYTAVLNDPENPLSISDNAANKVFEDSKGNIWIATYNGLNRLKKNSDDQFLFDRFKHDATRPNTSIPFNRVVALEEIDGMLYIGGDSGLCGFDLESETFFNFSEFEEKFSIQSIESTIDENLWASTTEGIIFFDTKLKFFNKYQKQDGLGDIIFQTGSSFRDQYGCLYFGSRKGITKFDPTKIKKNETPPPVYVTDIKIMSTHGEKNISGTFKNEIVLNHDEYFLSLDYVAINYNRSKKNKYAFKLEGFDKDWNYFNHKPSAVYTNLEHGTYTFKVKAANNDGVWNEVGKNLKIIKRPAFWETWWFRILSLMVLVALVIGVVKLYTRNIKNRNRVLKKYNEDLNLEIKRRELVEKELYAREVNIKKSNLELQRSNKDLEQFAYIASHDLQEPLRVVGGFISLLRRRYSQHFDESAIEYIGFAVDGVKRMSKQIENILTFSKVGKDEIVLESANLNNIIKVKIHDLSQKIKEKNAKVIVSPMPQIKCEKNQIAMVFHNLISNALKFNKSDQPKVFITHDAIPSKDFWQFSVKDNGIGIDPEFKKKVFEIFRRLHTIQEYEGTGIGLTLCEKIVHRHYGEIWFESKENEGTTFYFTISKKLEEQKVKMRPKTKIPEKEMNPEKLTLMN